MQKISPDSLLSDLILQNASLVPVLYLTGIRGAMDGKSIHAICKEKAINESFLLNLLNVFSDETFVPSETLPSYSVLQLTMLSSAIYPYFLNLLDSLFIETQKAETCSIVNNEKPQPEELFSSEVLKPLFAEYRRVISERFYQQKHLVLPHIATVYELYYCPDYTSEQADILMYSLDFYDGEIVAAIHGFEKIKKYLEDALESNCANLKDTQNVFAFYQLHHAIMAQERIEQKLLKPLVLQMEESIMTTFQKKKKIIRRNNYVSLPAGTLPLNVLSPREKEVLRLVAQGLMNKEIADQLQIGLTTVITHRKNIVAKLGIKTIPGLTVYAYMQGYLDDFILTNED